VRLFSDLWEYRQALRYFVMRDLTVRYKRSIFGFVWSFLNPLMMILTFVVVFKYLWPNSEPNYTVKLMCTMLAWRFFNSAVMDGSASIGAKLSIVKRVNFPRVIMPASSLVANFVDYLFSLIILAAILLIQRVTLHWPYLGLAVLAMVIQIIFTLGLSLMLSSLSVFFTDVQFLIGNLFQMWFFLTPVLYPAKGILHRIDSQQLPQIVKYIYFANPMAPLMMAYRSILPEQVPNNPLQGGLPDYYTFFAISAAVSLVIFVIGITMFRRWEPSFAKEG
jgi:lipopolysaccharide transport system permease protein